MPVILARPDSPMERPGVGLVISSGETELTPGRHVAAFLGRSRRGPLHTPIRCTSIAQIERIFGGRPFGGGFGNTMSGAMEALRGGAYAVWVVRMGSGGTASGVDLLEVEDGDDGGAAAIRVEAPGPGTDGDRLRVALLGAADDATRVLIVLDGDVERERIRYAPGSPETEVDNLVAAFNLLGSDWITLRKLDDSATGASLAETPATPMTGGANPTTTIADIQAGMDALASRPFEVIAPDFVEDTEVDLFVYGLNDWIMGGKLCLGVVGSNPESAWSRRVQRAQQLNNPAIIYTSNGFVGSQPLLPPGSNTVQGHNVAAREAGRHAALPLARQLTHAVLRDGLQTIGEPAPDVIAEANAAGVYLYSTNERGQVWTEWGLTTFSNTARIPPWALSADIGWRKSRLVLTRFRLLTDIGLALSPLIETATNNAPGRASVIAQAQAVIDDQYIPTGAVTEGTVMQHPDYPPFGERFTMLIAPLSTPDGTEQLVVEARFRR
jgi:hypothetical protein